MEELEELRYLGALGLQIKLHWEKHRPAMYRQLEQSGKLLQVREFPPSLNKIAVNNCF